MRQTTTPTPTVTLLQPAAAAHSLAAGPTPVTRDPSQQPTPAEPSSVTIRRPILGALVADVSKSGFVMTFLAIVALAISVWSLRVAISQQAAQPTIVPTPYQVNTLVQPRIMKPVYQVYDLPQRNLGYDRPPICPMIAPTPNPQPSTATLLTVANWDGFEKKVVATEPPL